MKFRLLNADEIEVRVGGITSGRGGYLLLYKDARSDMNILDETVGANNWQRSHDLIDGQLFSTVSIYDEEKKTWIHKQDVGVESYTEKEKGRASDSFKRACVNWGIGRELYTAPFIWISDKTANKDSWKYKKFRVKDIGYDGKSRINYLVIETQEGRSWIEAFRFGRATASKKQAQARKTKTSNEPTEEEIKELWSRVMEMKPQFPEIEEEFKATMRILLGQEEATFAGIKRDEFNALQEFLSHKLEDFEREQTELWGSQHG